MPPFSKTVTTVLQCAESAAAIATAVMCSCGTNRARSTRQKPSVTVHDANAPQAATEMWKLQKHRCRYAHSYRMPVPKVERLVPGSHNVWLRCKVFGHGGQGFKTLQQ